MSDYLPVCLPDMSDCNAKCKYGTSDNPTKLTSCTDPCECHDDASRPPAILDEEDGVCILQRPYGDCPCAFATNQTWVSTSCQDPDWIPSGNEQKYWTFSWSVNPYDGDLGFRYVKFNFGNGFAFATVTNVQNGSGSVTVGPYNTNEIDYGWYNANSNYTVSIEVSCPYF